MVRTQRRPPALWIWSGVISVIVIVITVHVLGVQPLAFGRAAVERQGQTPVLTGSTYEEAVDALQELGLPATPVEKTDDTVPAGQVISTDPPAGQIVDSGTAVTVFVSTGRQAVALPDLRNKSLEQAEGRSSRRSASCRRRVPGAVTDRAGRTRCSAPARGGSSR